MVKFELKKVNVMMNVPKKHESLLICNEKIYQGFCYSNSCYISCRLNHDYVFGFVKFHDIPMMIEHAWNVDKFGNHYDLTASKYFPSASKEYTQLCVVDHEVSAKNHENLVDMDFFYFRDMDGFREIHKKALLQN